MDHTYVVENDECRAIILHDLEKIRQKDEEIPTRKFARPRISHEILFAIGGCWRVGKENSYESQSNV
jgi:hypothetical protein